MTKFLKNADVTGYISQTLVTSSLLKTDSAGKLVAATAGTDYQAPTTALLPTGGTAGQILSKIDATNYNTQWIDNFAAQLKHDVKLGATLAKGKAVYVSSANGTNMIVSAASNASEATSSKTLGLLETGGATNDIVKVITEGLLAGLDTSTATAGDPVWLGTSGDLIFGLANKPVAPAHLVFIGVVTRVQSVNGEIFVKVQNGFELNEIHNVLLSSAANNEGLFYESATSLWKNKSIATVLGYTPADDSAVVHNTGNETIAGVKTFTGGSLYINSGNTSTAGTLYLGDGSITKAPGSGFTLSSLSVTGNSSFSSFIDMVAGSVTTPQIKGIGGSTGIYLPNGATGTAIGFAYAGARMFESVGVASGVNYLRVTQSIAGSSPSLSAQGTDANINLTLTPKGTGGVITSSSLTATSLIKTGGTSAEILAADGSVITAGTGISISGGTIAATGGASSSARTEQTFTATTGSNTFTVTGGYTVGLIDVYVNGVKYPPSDYTASTGTTVVIGGLVSGDIVSTIAYTSTISLLPTSRDVIEYTATSGQVDFTVSGGYVIGLLDVYVNGTKLTSSEYTMPDTTKFTLAIASVAGNQVQAIRYNASTTGISGSGTANYLPKFTATGTIGNSAITDNGTTVTLVSRALSGTSATFSGDLTLNNGSADGGQLVLASSGYSSWNLDNYSGSLRAYYGSTVAMSINSTGAATFTGAQNATTTYTFQNTDTTNSNSRAYINLVSGTSYLTLKSIHGDHSYIDSSANLYFQSGNAVKMTILSGGNVGIGTTPQWALSGYTALEIGLGGLIYSSNGSGTGINLTNNMYHNGSNWIYKNTGGGSIIAQNSGVITFENAPSGTAGATASISERMRITSDGRVNIGTTNTQDARLTLNYSGGVDWAVGPKSGTSAFVINASSGGAYLINGGTSWNAWSDRRLKKNIQNLNYGLNEILSIEAIRYNYLTDSNDDSNRIGFIAQNVQEFLPEIVNSAYQDMLGIATTDLIPVLVKAVQELKAELDLLKNN